MQNFSTKKIAGLGILTALVILIQLFVHIQFGIFSLSTVLVPIVIGACLYGVFAGGWLGFVFGAVVILSGEATFFMGINVGGTIVTVISKGILCGLIPALIYKTFCDKNKKMATIIASISAPVTNTGVFIVCCLIFFRDFNLKYILTAFVGVNFFFEVAFNALLIPTVIFLLRYATQGRERSLK